MTDAGQNDEGAERPRQPAEDRHSLQFSEPTGELAGGDGAASPDPATPNLAAHVDSEGMAIGMESGEEVSPTGRGASQRVAPPGVRLEGATEPADATPDPPTPELERTERSTPPSAPRDERGEDED